MTRPTTTSMEGSRRESRSLVDVGSSAILFLAFYLMHCAAGQHQQQQLLLSTDHTALLNLRSSLGLQAKDWPIKGNPCTNWTGIECEEGRVAGINISGFKRTRRGRKNPRFAINALGNLTQLYSFNASGFLLPGPIPDWLGTRVSSLRTLDLRSCSVTGAIPSSLGSLSRLRSLYLSDNSLTGSINSNLGQLRELSNLNLSGNLLTGPIPDEFSMLGSLTRLDLSSNFISGPIPLSLGSLPGLLVLNLSDNSLTSWFPVQFSKLAELTILDLSMNSISGLLPAEISSLTRLKVLRIGSNALGGELSPTFFSALARLEVMDVSGNNFTGEFPRIGSRTEVDNAMFNFSNNMFYGTLNLSWLEVSGSVDLSGNYFQGNVSTIGGRNTINLENNCLQVVQRQRSLLDCREFYMQIGLVFDDFGTPQPTEPPFPKEFARKNRRRLWVYILIGMGGGLGFILSLLLVVLLHRRFRRGKSGQRGRSIDACPLPEGENRSIPKDSFTVPGFGDSFTYDQMVRATSDFNESNLIKNGHSGDLYLGMLDGRAPVVIKRIAGSGSSPFKSKKEPYAVELEFFRRASHMRLVPLLGHCLEMEQEKMLVYKYMPNGDLASSFFRATESENGSFQSLDWITRLKIAIGAAEGLSYLHHECSPPLVHRDVQASSILLDDKFEVRLGSLSEVQAQEGDPRHNVIARLLRKSPTSEGPSGPPKATCAYDVFCFGKVLLELVTGKIGFGQSDDATLREWLEQTLPFISLFDKELVTKIVDPSLIVDEDLLEEVWAMAIVARSCLNPKPVKRPPMKYILRALENPLKVVREGSYSGSSSRLRNNSSRRSWSTAFFGSWRHSLSEGAVIPGHFNGGLRQSGRMGSHSSGGNDHSFSHKRASSEIFPEPVSITDLERPDGH